MQIANYWNKANLWSHNGCHHRVVVGRRHRVIRKSTIAILVGRQFSPIIDIPATSSFCAVCGDPKHRARIESGRLGAPGLLHSGSGGRAQSWADWLNPKSNGRNSTLGASAFIFEPDNVSISLTALCGDALSLAIAACRLQFNPSVVLPVEVITREVHTSPTMQSTAKTVIAPPRSCRARSASRAMRSPFPKTWPSDREQRAGIMGILPGLKRFVGATTPLAVAEQSKGTQC